MNIDEQFEQFLAELGVEMEQSAEQPHDGTPEVSIFQASREHYGVFYRLDIINAAPELRIIVPVDAGEAKMEIYLVRLSQRTPLNASFAQMSAYEGSPAYEQGREATLQHLLYAVAEMMKLLFWSGDLESMTFPPEIQVVPLLLNDDQKTHKKH